MYLSHLLIDVGQNPDRPRPGRLWLRNLYRVHQRLAMAFPSEKCDRNPLKPYNPDDAPEDAPAKAILEGRADVHEERSDSNGFLFRIDYGVAQDDGGRLAVILVQSAKRPEWDYAFGFKPGERHPDTGRPVGNSACLLAAPPDWKEMKCESILKRGPQFLFRLNANPTRRINNGPFKGKRVSVGRGPMAVLDWLARKGEVREKNGKKEGGGFELVFKKPEDGKGDWDPRWRVTTGMLHAWKEKGDDDEPKAKMSFAYAMIDGILKVTDPTLFANTLVTGIGPAKAFGFGLLSIAPVEDRAG